MNSICGIESAVPPGLGLWDAKPGVETPGYYQRSLGDKDQRKPDLR